MHIFDFFRDIFSFFGAFSRFFFGVKFGFRISCLCKRNDKYEVCPCFCFSAIAARFVNEESEKLFPSRSTPISSLPLILPQVDSKLVQAIHSFVSHTAIFLSCKKRNHLQVRASKVSSKNDWEKEKRAKVIIIWGQAEL